MKNDIIDICANIRAGRFVNEAAVSQGIVLRLLSQLAWPTYDTSVVSPEYSVRGKRVDYALCHPPGKPLVFIEVKQVGHSGDAEQQLFEYAVHHGVPLAILTTGQEWQFFLPGERGDYGERRVYKLDFLERTPEESVYRSERYLGYRSVCSGEAIDAASMDYRDIRKEREVLRTLPEAWTKLVDEGDELLLELLADKVESLCGYPADVNTVATFLTERVKVVPAQPALGARVTATPRELRPAPRVMPRSSEPLVYVLEGQRYSANNCRDVLIKVLQYLANRDPSFAERLAARTMSRRERRYFARTKEELYPASPHLADTYSNTRELFPGAGWWIDLNLSCKTMEQVIRIACSVAGIEYGVDVKVDLS